MSIKLHADKVNNFCPPSDKFPPSNHLWTLGNYYLGINGIYFVSILKGSKSIKDPVVSFYTRATPIGFLNH